MPSFVDGGVCVQESESDHYPMASTKDLSLMAT